MFKKKREAMKLSLCLLFGATFFLGGCGKQASHEAFQNCLLNKIGTASDARVAIMLREECAKKYQIEMSQSTLANLKFKLETKVNRIILNSPPYITITIENGNRDWILTEIEYSASPNPLTTQKPYIKTIYIEPLTEGYIGMLEDAVAEEGSINLIKAWGMHVKR